MRRIILEKNDNLFAWKWKTTCLETDKICGDKGSNT